MGHRRDRNRSGAEQLAGSLTLLGVFGVLYFAMPGAWWPLVVAAFAIPGVIRGVQKIAAERAAKRISERTLPVDRDTEATKQVLKVAQELGGIVTPTLVTLHSSLSLEEAERILQSMSSKGYASMNVTDSGRIEYEFPEFVDRIEHQKE
ncbi:MAG TPA: hypothetical protein VMV68_00140 [Spirochaetia bacterium]|nr:hypothetical protein [Spirochaetia bacterium]